MNNRKKLKMIQKINKKELIKYFKNWLQDATEELRGSKMIFPDDWPEDFAEQSARYFIEYFGVNDE